MELFKFCNKINLPGQAVEILRALSCKESEYESIKKIFLNNKTDFFQAIRQRDNEFALFLYYYCRFACDAFDLYSQKNISEKIYWNTFGDITVWCRNCYQKYGKYGIAEYDWLWRHVELKLFRLGRLQFEPITAETDLKASHFSVKKGSILINVHIPEGEPLDEEACEESFVQAKDFFKNSYYYVCHSWLLYPGLKELLQKESNIIKFQNRFEIIQTDYETREAEERIFPQLEEYPEAYPLTTKLQDRARTYLMEGHRLGSGLGILQQAAQRVNLRNIADSDEEIFREWLLEEHVARWYEHPLDWLFEMKNRNGKYNFIHHFIVEYEGKGIGFCQYYEYVRSDEAWHGDIAAEGTYSIDYLIGDEKYLGRGLGRATVKLVTQMVFSNSGAERIIVQPDPENAASCNTLLSAGFKYDDKNKLYRYERYEKALPTD